MKTKTVLLSVLGLTSYAALAQLHPPPEPLPLPGRSAQSCCGPSAPGSGMRSQQTSPPSPPAGDAGSAAPMAVPPPLWTRVPDASGSSGTSESSDSSGMSGSSDITAPTGTQDGSGAYGHAGRAGTSGDTSTATPAEPGGSSGTSGAGQDLSSGASGMQTEAGAELRAQSAPVVQLQPKTQGDVTYLCGGVGQDEAGYMKKEARAYDMMLTFATRDGGYLADVNVDIKDAGGNPVLQARCDGPMMLIDLPKSGTYRIHADTAGYTLDRTARVQVKRGKSSHVASVVLTWPQQVAEAPSTSETSSGSSGGNSGGGNDNSDIKRGGSGEGAR